mmetsp:Transcript_59808/g.110715  ORF Transcript_59808/g.110715 Transcript_59808/m.110715 type:complete len:466 (-) Transcript_59808:33-1430(-)
MLRPVAAICVAEFTGTFLLVFTIGCNVLSGNGVWGVVSTASTLVALVYIFSGVSGAHFNPAVTLSLAASGKLPAQQAMVYCGLQLVGGCCGAGAFVLLFWETLLFAPMRGFSAWQAGAVEGIYCFMLCFVILNGAPQRRRGHQFFGLAIGMVLAAGGIAAGPLSGSCLNPAVSIALDVASSGKGFGWCLVYVGFQLAGAALASLLYRLLRPNEFLHGTREEAASTSTFMPMMAGEFIGTFMIVLTHELGRAADSFGWALGVGAAVLSMMFALGDICGVQFNPAVTLTVTASCRGKCSAAQAARFVGVQLCAALAAAVVASVLNPPQVQVLEDSEFSAFPAALAEMIFTFLICMTFLGTIVVDEPWRLTEYFGVAVAVAVTGGAFASQRISGGFLNPAAALAVSLVGPHGLSTLLWRGAVYILSELLGAFLAAWMFWFVCPDSRELTFIATGKPRPVTYASPAAGV